MIKINLSNLLDKRDMSQRDLCKLTKIRPGTVGAYYHGFVKRINVDDLNKICETLECSLDELIEHIPDKK